MTCDFFRSEKQGRESIGVGVGIGIELLKPIPIPTPIPTPKTHPELQNIQSGVAGGRADSWLLRIPARRRTERTQLITKAGGDFKERRPLGKDFGGG
ncbi:MAG: hypothetical protein JXR49_01420 [Acidobacteria bacterium]|nr:hypothetical protein [Acidobacteriota bacterium]